MRRYFIFGCLFIALFDALCNYFGFYHLPQLPNWFFVIIGVALTLVVQDKLTSKQTHSKRTLDGEESQLIRTEDSLVETDDNLTETTSTFGESPVTEFKEAPMSSRIDGRSYLRQREAPKSLQSRTAPATTDGTQTLTPMHSTEPSVYKPKNIIAKQLHIPKGSGDAGHTSYSATFSTGTTSFGEIPLPPDSPVSDFPSISSTTFDRGYLRNRVAPIPLRSPTTHATTDWSRTLTPMHSAHRFGNRQPFNIKSSQAMSTVSSVKHSSVETLPCFENDLASDPSHTVTFASPSDEITSLTITNVTRDRIMWALKTNALDRIIATPTCGFLPAGTTVHLKMAIRENSVVRADDSSHDRLAIDYAFVPENCVTFDPTRIIGKQATARRKSFAINYVF